MPAMFFAVAIGFVGCLFVKNDEGITLAEVMAGRFGILSEFGEAVKNEQAAEYE